MEETLYNYLSIISSAAPSYLHELERETHLKILKPQMLTGFSQGRFLSLMAKLLNSKRILEIGTFTGYGSLCLAEGLSENGKLITIEISKENGWLAEKYFRQSPYFEQIELLYGNALDLISDNAEELDLAYIDADKQNNEKYFEMIWPKIRAGGLVLIDNIFARGGVFKPEGEQKKFEKSVTEFNQKLLVMATGGKVTILPLRDGLSIVRKE